MPKRIIYILVLVPTLLFILQSFRAYQISKQYLALSKSPNYERVEAVVFDMLSLNSYAQDGIKVLEKRLQLLSEEVERQQIEWSELYERAQWKSLGYFWVTHYCVEQYPHICNAGAPYRTATGTPVTAYRSLAVCPTTIPLGSIIKLAECKIDNSIKWVAENTGGAIKGRRIDLAVETHAQAMRLGRYRTEVFIYIGGE